MASMFLVLSPTHLLSNSAQFTTCGSWARAVLCMYVHTCALYVRMRVCVCVCVCVCTYIRVCTCEHVCLCVCMHVCACMIIYVVCMYMCVYGCVTQGWGGGLPWGVSPLHSPRPPRPLTCLYQELRAAAQWCPGCGYNVKKKKWEKGGGRERRWKDRHVMWERLDANLFSIRSKSPLTKQDGPAQWRLCSSHVQHTTRLRVHLPCFFKLHNLPQCLDEVIRNYDLVQTTRWDHSPMEILNTADWKSMKHS